jgi:hypothetical protein
MRVYLGLRPEEIDEIEQIALECRAFPYRPPGRRLSE